MAFYNWIELHWVFSIRYVCHLVNTSFFRSLNLPFISIALQCFHCTKNEVFHYILKKSLMENFIFCAVLIVTETLALTLHWLTFTRLLVSICITFSSWKISISQTIALILLEFEAPDASFILNHSLVELLAYLESTVIMSNRIFWSWCFPSNIDYEFLT